MPSDAAAPTTHRAATSVVVALAASCLLLFLAAPIVGLVGAGGAAGISELVRDSELQRSIILTFACAIAATTIAFALGTPLAYLLARRRVPAPSIVAAIVDLPLVVPHPVAGIALLLVLGRQSPAGAALTRLGLEIVGTPAGIICAMLFVSAPLYVAGAREAFARVDIRLEHVARTLGDTPWRAVQRVTMPLASRGLWSAAIITWARAVSEFGAIVILAYTPKVASVLSYERFVSFGLGEALPVAAALVLLALVPLAALRALDRPRDAA